MRTCRIEITEQSGVPVRSIFAGFCSIVTLCLDVVGDDVFVCGLGASIGVCRADRAMLWNWNHVWKACGVAIDGGRRGENDVGHIVLGHATEQADCAVHICAIVFKRDFA